MVRRLIVGLVAVIAVGGVGVISQLPSAEANTPQSPATHFVHCPDGQTCLAPAVTLERD
jgi:hypothetical protein